MIIRNVFIKSKLILTAALILLLLFILSWIYLDSSRGLETRSALLEVRKAIGGLKHLSGRMRQELLENDTFTLPQFRDHFRKEFTSWMDHAR